METSLQQSIRDTFSDLTGLLSGLSQEQIDRQPANGWSAGQATEHIIKAASGLSDLFNGPTAKAQRPPDAQVKPLRDLFLNREIRMQSPEFILPTADVHPREQMVGTLDAIRSEMDQLAGNMDLDVICEQEEFPTFGYLSRREWLNFVLFHTQRHTAQIKDIIQRQQA